MDNTAGLTDAAYAQMVKQASPNSKSAKNILAAFWVGGLICTLGEALINLYLSLGMETDLAFGATTVTLIFLSALLTGLNVYDRIAKYAGAGTLVPVTGFANAVAAPALEFKTEGWVLGLAAKMFVIAGPVIVYGILSGVAYGLILWLFKLY